MISRNNPPTSIAGAVAALGLLLGLSIGPALFAQPEAEVTSFQFKATQAALDDLKDRLKRTRWPDRETVKDWSQGVPLAKLQALVKYWQTDYDWRRCETKLNSFPQ